MNTQEKSALLKSLWEAKPKKYFDNDLKKTRFRLISSEDFDAIQDFDIELAIMDTLWSKQYYLKNEYEMVMGFSEPQKTIYVLYEVQHGLFNGGFWEYYLSSQGKFTKLTESAFNLIGAPKFADVMKRANEIFFSEQEEPNYDLLDKEYYALEKEINLDKLKIDFIRKNKISFLDVS